MVAWDEEHTANLQSGLSNLALGTRNPIDPARFVGPFSLRVMVGTGGPPSGWRRSRSPAFCTPSPLSPPRAPANHHPRRRRSAHPSYTRAQSAESAASDHGDWRNWTQITGVPAEFADGIDDGARDAADTGLTRAGATLAVDALLAPEHARAARECTGTGGGSFRCVLTARRLPRLHALARACPCLRVPRV
jgi:hypothetical protein